MLVGLPLGLDGADTAQTRETRAFAERLAGRLGEEIPVQLHDERFTTRMAQRLSGDSRAAEDSRAAAHLLEDWLASAARPLRSWAPCPASNDQGPRSRVGSASARHGGARRRGPAAAARPAAGPAGAADGGRGRARGRGGAPHLPPPQPPRGEHPDDRQGRDPGGVHAAADSPHRRPRRAQGQLPGRLPHLAAAEPGLVRGAGGHAEPRRLPVPGDLRNLRRATPSAAWSKTSWWRSRKKSVTASMPVPGRCT